MTVFRCKSCGGDLEIVEGSSICTCEYCGKKQTLPTVKDEGTQNLFNRANTLRLKSEFDKAAEYYERIIQQNSEEAEAYWGLILCKYGIEYVEDPATGKRIPTCHRASFDAVTADEDYKKALEYADTLQRGVYEAEADAIDTIQKGIIALAQKEGPYDVFICYKETDENGKRTQDSVIANDIYHQLTQEGFKVFYAAITLEDKLGTEYEPYIFSALNSAKVMLALGTKAEYFNAVWVKNEWSRFLKIMKKERGRLLIPCYRDMDPYDLPDDFAHLQAQDMSKIGFINDLVRGIKKVVVKENDSKKESVADVPKSGPEGHSASFATLLKRGQIALEDHEWDKATDFYDEALYQDAECAEAYLGQFLAKENVSSLEMCVQSVKRRISTVKAERLVAKVEDISHVEKMVEENEAEIGGYLTKSEISQMYIFDAGYDSVLVSRKEQKSAVISSLENDKLLTRVKKYASEEIASKYKHFMEEISAILDKNLREAQAEDERSVELKKEEYAAFLAETDELVKQKSKEAKEQREKDFSALVEAVEKATMVYQFRDTAEELEKFRGYKDCDELIERCRQESLRIESEQRMIAAEHAELKRQKDAREKRKIALIVSSSVLLIIALMITVSIVRKVKTNNEYKAAVALMNEERYEEAIVAFEAMVGYKDSQSQIIQCQSGIVEKQYNDAVALINEERYEEAMAVFEAMGDYKDSQSQIIQCQSGIVEKQYNDAVALMNEERYEEATAVFEAMGDYKDSQNMVLENKYKVAERLYANGELRAAYVAYLGMNGYKDTEEKASDIINNNLGIALSGDEIIFGNARWIVLENENGKLLVLRKYAIEKRLYNEEKESITWEKCTLRTWLNEGYLQTEFTPEEQSKIILRDIKNEDNAAYGTEAGSDTKDKIFLLSIDEVYNYFKSDEERKTTLADGTSVWWWLRSPGDDSIRAAFVVSDGSVRDNGAYVNGIIYGKGAVRPALWIDTTNP